MKQFKKFLLESKNQYKISLLPDEVKHFNIALELNSFIQNRFPEYVTPLVGGACRDLFFRKFFGEDQQRNVDDLDFAIFHKDSQQGLIDIELKKLMEYIESLEDFSVVDEIKFLHLKVIHNPTKYEIEYTSTRKEAYQDNTRKPETVVGNVIEDILRRDFTVNAIYLNIESIESNSVIVQPLNQHIEKNIEDIKNKILRTTTENPEDVFFDDPLRVLRAVRFSGYSYDMSPEVEKHVKNFDKNILFDKVSNERISDELGKILKKGDVDYLIKSGFIKKIIEEFGDFDNKKYKDAELQHIVDVIKVAREKAPKGKKLLFLLTALFHDIGKGDTGTFSDKKDKWQFLGHETESAEKAEKIMRELKFSNKIISDVTNLIREHMTTKFFDKMPLKTIIKWILKYDNEQKYPSLIENVLHFNTIDWGGKPDEWREKNKDMIKNERTVAKKVLLLQKKIKEYKKTYKEELAKISMEIGKDKHIPATSKAGAILKRHANFIIVKLKQEGVEL